MSTVLNEREVVASKLFKGLATKPLAEVHALMEQFPTPTVHYGALRQSQMGELDVYVARDGKDIQVLAAFYDGQRVALPTGIVERGMDLQFWSSEIVTFFNYNTVDRAEIQKLSELVDYVDRRDGEIRQRSRGQKIIVPGLIGHNLKPHTSKVLVRVIS